MAGFNGLLDATFNPPRNWILNEALSYDCDILSEKDIEMLRYCSVSVGDNTTICCVLYRLV